MTTADGSVSAVIRLTVADSLTPPTRSMGQEGMVARQPVALRPHRSCLHRGLAKQTQTIPT